MTWEEAEARQWLEQQFWAEFQSSQMKFCWLPKRNFETGRWMWMCKAVEALSGHTVDVGGSEYEFKTTRWYRPKDFTTLALRKL